MVRTFSGDSLVIATHNSGKLREIADLLRQYVAHFASAGDLGLAEPEETGASFVENAELKARAAANASGRVSVADDSGLAVDALGGQPGIYSARWAGPGKDFAQAMGRVQAELGDNPDRRAHFVCALSMAWPDGHCETVEGVVHGSLVWPPRGDQGFGYDPMFVADGFELTFGEMNSDEKHRISHRADAFNKLVARCFGAAR